VGYLLARPHGPLELPASASRLRQGCDRDPNCVMCFFNHSNSITSLINLGLAWLIRASWLIWGSIVHRINHVAPINHDLFRGRTYRSCSDAPSGAWRHATMVKSPGRG
jgi:hypothetical protein